MSNEFLENLRPQPRPGFNKLERDWYFDRFQSERGRVEALKTLAEDISQSLNEPLDTVAALIVRSSSGDTEAIGKLTRWLPEITQLEDNAKRSSQSANRDMAEMILCSRLPIEWIVGRLEYLETTYLVEFPDTDWDMLKAQKANKFLGSESRWQVIRAITMMLPGSIVSEIADYAMSELFDGNPPEPEPEQPLEDQIKKPLDESLNLEKTEPDLMNTSGASISLSAI